MSRKRGREKQGSRTPFTPARRARGAAGATELSPERPGWRARWRRRLRNARDVLVLPAIVVGFLLAIFLLAISPQAISLLHRETVVDTVVKSERVNYGESSKYLVYGQHEVYQNTDSFVLLKFRSSDFYRDIEVGKTYRFEVVGWRIPLFSLYRNIVAFEEAAGEGE